LGKSTITLYVDGARDCVAPLRYPSDLNRKTPLTRLAIANNTRVSPDEDMPVPLNAQVMWCLFVSVLMFNRQLGDVCLYADVLAASDVRLQFE
jgi:hypothetical protein